MCNLSGRKVALPLPSPLRTGLASFPASGSSLHKRLLKVGASTITVHLGMVLPVTIRVQHHQILSFITATSGFIDDMV